MEPIEIDMIDRDKIGEIILELLDTHNEINISVKGRRTTGEDMQVLMAPETDPAILEAAYKSAFTYSDFIQSRRTACTESQILITAS